MNYRHLLFLFLFGLSVCNAYAQTDSTDSQEQEYDDEEATTFIPEINEELKFGVKFGSGMCSMIGNELSNPKPTYMLSGGAYARYRFKEHWLFQPEVNVSLRGSNFNNGTLEYSVMRMYYIDVPVLLLYGLNEKNTRTVLAGLQYSQMLNSSLYLTGSNVADATSIGLKPYDVAAVAGMQFLTPFIGFQIAVKYGLIDINDGLLPNLNPPNKGKDIHNIALELNMLF